MEGFVVGYGSADYGLSVEVYGEFPTRDAAEVSAEGWMSKGWRWARILDEDEAERMRRLCPQKFFVRG